jgi:hypothetical protein
VISLEVSADEQEGPCFGEDDSCVSLEGSPGAVVNQPLEAFDILLIRHMHRNYHLQHFFFRFTIHDGQP